MAHKILFVGRRTTDMPSVEGVDDTVPPKGYGVYGWSQRGGYGLVGESDFSIAVYGTSVRNIGVSGSGFKAGVYGGTGGADSIGVYGENYGGDFGYGVLGYSNRGLGVYGYSYRDYGVFGRSYEGYAVTGYSDKVGVAGISPSGFGVGGVSDSGFGVYGSSGSSYGVYGESPSGFGVYGRSDRRIGVYGASTSGFGVYGSSTYGHGVYGQSGSGYAALLDGNVRITGNLQKAGGSFRIDHPLDPANKYLYHSFVESPDMKNVYDGVVILDDKGEAEIELPDWFSVLNKDFRYQLTAIGAPGPNLHIAEEISDNTTKHGSDGDDSSDNNNNRFKIAGGTSGMKVSWHVTGIRKDPWANAHRIRVEEDKPETERGYYIYPELYGQPKENGISHLLFPKERQELLINENKA
jgi:hypothetical protein